RPFPKEYSRLFPWQQQPDLQPPDITSGRIFFQCCLFSPVLSVRVLYRPVVDSRSSVSCCFSGRYCVKSNASFIRMPYSPSRSITGQSPSGSSMQYGDSLPPTFVFLHCCCCC